MTRHEGLGLLQLAGFFVLRMLAAAAAVFFQHQLFGGVGLAFLSRIVLAATNTTNKSN